MEKKIKAKALKRSAETILAKMQELDSRYRQGILLQFEAQDIETQRDFWEAIDRMKKFIDNIT